MEQMLSVHYRGKAPWIVLLLAFSKSPASVRPILLETFLETPLFELLASHANFLSHSCRLCAYFNLK